MGKITERLIGKYRGKLSKLFWIVNITNAFERGAYYGVMAIFSLHLVYNIGIDGRMVGYIQSLLMSFLYLLPLFSAAIAKKFGFRKLLIFAYATLGSGYFVLGLADGIEIVILGVLLIGVGSGFEKSLISASVAHTSDTENRSLAYSIYYSFINLGAFLIALVLSAAETAKLFPVLSESPLTGIYRFFPEFMSASERVIYDYTAVFFAMAGLILISFLITLFAYKNPLEPEPSTKVSDALNNMIFVLKDKKFAILLFIFSGYWFMFAMNHSFLPLYMVDFAVMPHWFPPPTLALVNPGTIIIGGSIVGKYTKKYEPMTLLIGGISICVIGLLMLGLTINPVLFIAGVIVSSIGEVIAYPGFLSYVSRIPPKEKLSLYMGYSFLPGAIGLTVGSYAGGELYTALAEGRNMIKLFWAVISCMGLVTAAAFMWYNKKYVITTPVKTESMNIGRVRIPVRNMPSFTPLLLIPVFLFVGFSLGTDPMYRTINVADYEYQWTHQDIRFDRTLNQGAFDSWEFNGNVDKIFMGANISVNWQPKPDEQSLLRIFVHQGSTYNVKLMLGNNVIEEKTVKNNPGSPGAIVFKYSHDYETYESLYLEYKYSVEVKLVDAGSYSASRPGLSSPPETNTGSYKIDVTWHYLEKTK